MDMEKIFAESLEEVIKVKYDFEIFEASDDLKKEIKSLIKGDKKAADMKKLAVKNKDNVPDYLDYLYVVYEKDIEKLSKQYKIDYDKIARVFLEV